MRSMKLKILKKDSKIVAKIVLIDNKGRALFLKRSNYMEKFAGDWDLPGGHIKLGENLLEGLKRETREETRIKIKNPVFLKKIENLYFFYEKFNSEKIKLSDEHTDYKFFKKSDLNPSEKFHKVAIQALEKIDA